MSSRLVGLVLEHYPVGGSEFTLAIVLADEADHSGGLIPSPVSELARLSRQSESTTRRLLRKMEYGTWLVCVDRSKGGHKRSSVYQINREWVRLPMAFQFGNEPSQIDRDEPSQIDRVHPGQNPVKLTGFPRETTPFLEDQSSLFKSITPYSPPKSSPNSGSAVPSATHGGMDINLKLAQWMLALIRAQHPKHREPNWRRWCRDISVMVRAGRSHREIAELFKVANDDREPKPGSDFCWAKVILSPAKLWKQWDALTIKRDTDPSRKPAVAEVDPLCSRCHERPWSMQRGKSGARVCGQCYDAADQRAA